MISSTNIETSTTKTDRFDVRTTTTSCTRKIATPRAIYSTKFPSGETELSLSWPNVKKSCTAVFHSTSTATIGSAKTATG